MTHFTSLGLVAEGGAGIAFVQRMGQGKANEGLILGKKISVGKLAQVGFVNMVFQDKSNFRQQVMEHLRQTFGRHLVGSSPVRDQVPPAPPLGQGAGRTSAVGDIRRVGLFLPGNSTR